MKLLNKAALITGAGSGIGRISAILFAKEGAMVTVVDLNERNGKDTVRHIQGESGEAFFVKADVSRALDAERMIKATVDTYGRLDILYNNAGIAMPFTPVENIKKEMWDRIIDVNVKSIFLASKYAVPIMKKQEGGVILNTACISGVRPQPGLSAYSTSKAAAIMLTKAMAIELAPFKIRVNVINPAAVDTPMLAQFMPDRKLSSKKYQHRIQKIVDTIPLGRLALGEDVAYIALFLVSDEASLITGASFDVDGGCGI